MLFGIAFAVFKLVQSRRPAELPAPPSRDPWPPVPAPEPEPAVVEEAAVAPRWVEPQGGVCPQSHPIKAKMSSMIFHLPGMANYTRTRPDRCYATEAAAAGDGFVPAKR